LTIKKSKKCWLIFCETKEVNLFKNYKIHYKVWVIVW
jgi:hypothetical protein